MVSLSPVVGGVWPLRERVNAWLHEPVAADSLAAFRVLFGLLNAFGAARFVLNGWVDRFFVQPTHFLPFWGFEWLPRLPAAGMYAVFGGIFVASVCVALGYRYRFAVAAQFLLFTYVELLDVSNYLNHYYLVSVLSLWMLLLPAGAHWSLDARRSQDGSTVPRWTVFALRAQLSIVYFFAGLAKLNSDWLLHAQPLNIWLSARTEVPIIGGMLDQWWVALAMSWSGFLFDLTIWAFLWWPPTTGLAYIVVLCFHGLTGALFKIGLFPVIMAVGTTIFFAPDWPARAWSRLRGRSILASAGLPGAGERPDRLRPAGKTGHRQGVRGRVSSRLVGACAVCLLGAQLALPLRAQVTAGDVNWHEHGMRWSWRVMVREKNGALTYRVHSPAEDRTWLVPASRYLTPQQEREMAGQPDLILVLAHWIAADFRESGVVDAEVYADALVSLNGRRPAPLVDNTIDLARQRRSLLRPAWISEAPTEAPPHLERMR
jgi:hypothetical protein